MHDQQIALLPDDWDYIVRRLTPLECCRLQGFPDWWTWGLETPEPTEEDILYWSDVHEQHRLITKPINKKTGELVRSKTRNEVIKWLKSPQSDSAEYKMWGNSLAIPCAYTVLAGIEEVVKFEKHSEKLQKAILRIQSAAEMAEAMGNNLILAYSGGKDSDVLLDIAIKSGVKFDVQHNHTTADAPQTVYHIREVFARLESQGITTKINYPKISMWDLIVHKGMPPTRLMRYCCSYLKERVFEGQHIMTGIRWHESTPRKGRGLHETLNKDKEKRIVYYDENDDQHKLTDVCYKHHRVATNPIIDWSDEEIWDYIKDYEIPMNPLYSQGYKRVGCIGCPMAGKGVIKEFRDFPKYKQMYIRAFDRMIEKRRKAEKYVDEYWVDGESVFKWWVNPKYNPNQITFDESIDDIDLSRLPPRYSTAKKQCPGHFLLLRLGDFYEVFGEQAKISSEVCGFTITARKEIPMCGFPAHALEKYAELLIAEGYKIALIEENGEIEDYDTEYKRVAKGIKV
jgi:phosphoadenosine phosphosulfate reductase